MEDLAGRTAVVTAGGNGIGRAIAHALADVGMDVVVSDIDLAAATRVRDELTTRGRRAIAVRTDVSRLDEVTQLADAAYDEFGRVDVLCNNAGVAVRPMRAIWDTSYEDMQWMMNVNLWGMLNAVHVFVPRMRRQGGRKHIVNTASMAAVLTVPGNAMYGLSKYGIDGFSDVIREELALEDIGVTVLYPGLVSTDAPANTRRLRTPEQQAADDRATPFAEYARAKGPESGSEVNGRGGYSVMGAGETTRPIDAGVVGPMVVEAIRANHPRCMTHPVPVDAINARAASLLESYRPIP